VWWATHNSPAGEALIILTDSLNTIDCIIHALHFPQRMKQHHHKDIFQDIVETTLNRPFSRVIIGKVRAHIGVHGNEEADTLAKAAAESDTADVVSPPLTSTGTFAVYPNERDVAGDINNGPILLPNIRKHVSKIWHRIHAHGTNTMTAKSWAQAASSFLPSESNVFLTQKGALPWKHVKLAVQVRHRAWMGRNLRHKQGKCDTPFCASCVSRGIQRKDTAQHMATACSEPQLKLMYADRSNTTGRTIVKGIKKGRYGAYSVFANCGTEPDIPHESTVKPWMTQYDGIPDIMLAIGVHPVPGRANRAPAQSDPTSITLAPLEIAYTDDTNLLRKERQKHAKYTPLPNNADDAHIREQLQQWGENVYDNLIFKLRNAGFTVMGYNSDTGTVGTQPEHNRIMTLVFGITGCIPANARTILKAVGVPHQQQTTLLKNIHLQALRSLYAMNGVHWHLHNRQGVG
jgi:hypothetical protein